MGIDRRDQRVLEPNVRQALRREVVGVELGLHRIRPSGERVTRRVREMLRPRDRDALRVDPGANAMHARGPIVVVLQVVFARTHDLDRRTDRLRQKRRLAGVVDHESSTESAAAPLHVHGDVRARDTHDLCDEILRVAGILGRPPEL